MTVQNFGQIQNKNLQPKDFSKEVVFDRQHSFGRICKVIPDKQVKSINLTWILPVTKTFDTKRSCDYLGHVIGHEGPNSLLSELIRTNLGISISAGATHRLNQAFDQFDVEIELTELGE